MFRGFRKRSDRRELEEEEIVMYSDTSLSSGISGAIAQ